MYQVWAYVVRNIEEASDEDIIKLNFIDLFGFNNLFFYFLNYMGKQKFDFQMAILSIYYCSGSTFCHQN